MSGLPTWFHSLVLSEMVVQLPFFFVAIYAFLGASACTGDDCACARGQHEVAWWRGWHQASRTVNVQPIAATA